MKDPKAALYFTWYAWQKLLYFRDQGATEVSALAQSPPDDPLTIIDLHFLPQQCTSAWTEFDDAAIRAFFDDMIATGHKHQEFDRKWVHTHPGNSASPSGQDETTFKDSFGHCSWAIMFILAKGGNLTCRLRAKTDFGDISQEIPVLILDPTGTITIPFDTWSQLHKENIRPKTYAFNGPGMGFQGGTPYSNTFRTDAPQDPRLQAEPAGPNDPQTLPLTPAEINHLNSDPNCERWWHWADLHDPEDRKFLRESCIPDHLHPRTTTPSGTLDPVDQMGFGAE